MIQTGFWIGERDWWVMASLDIKERDLGGVYDTLLGCECADDEARHACMVLSRRNSGYTFTNMDGRYTLMFASAATSAEEMFDTVTHELKHAVEHLNGYFGVEPSSERAAYLQGEIGRKMFAAVALAVCPSCHCAED